MKYERIREAVFKSRPNRFVAEVLLDDKLETVHVKNTGRCQELLIEGVKVILEEASNPERKTKYDLVAVFNEEYGWINIDSQLPNAVVKEWLEKDRSLFENITFLKPEYKFGSSRIDFYLEQDDIKTLIEVKGCTLIKHGLGYFPDAPTDRGLKHLRELEEAAKNGYKCYVAFVIQVNGIKYVLPNKETQPQFAYALRDAIRAGVNVLLLSCNVADDSLEIADYKLMSHL